MAFCVLHRCHFALIKIQHRERKKIFYRNKWAINHIKQNDDMIELYNCFHLFRIVSASWRFDFVDAMHVRLIVSIGNVKLERHSNAYDCEKWTRPMYRLYRWRDIHGVSVASFFSFIIIFENGDCVWCSFFIDSQHKHLPSQCTTREVQP